MFKIIKDIFKYLTNNCVEVNSVVVVKTSINFRIDVIVSDLNDNYSQNSSRSIISPDRKKRLKVELRDQKQCKTNSRRDGTSSDGIKSHGISSFLVIS